MAFAFMRPLIIKIVLILIALLIGALLAVFLHQHPLRSEAQTDVQSLRDPSCDLSQRTCSFLQADNKEIKIYLSQKGELKAMLPQRINIEWPELEDRHLQLSITGLEMFMGELRVQLTQRSPGFYQGEFILPLCSTELMKWLGEVKAPSKQNLALEFEITTVP